jgi:hypothetical protein
LQPVFCIDLEADPITKPSGAGHDTLDQPGRRLIYVQMIDLLTGLGDKVFVLQLFRLFMTLVVC